MRTFLISTASLSAFFLSATAVAATITVGPNGSMHAAPCAAVAAAVENDVIEIDTTGTYEKDYCVIDKNGLTLKGVGAGRAKIDAKLEGVEVLPLGNAIWVISADDVKIEKIELTGAKDSTKKTGAGIHQTGKGLTVTDCSIHDNDSGILVDDDPAGEVVVERSELGFNGIDADDDPGHIAVGKIAKLTLTGSYLHHGVRVTMVKSNAAENHILYNRITSETDGVSRYSVDLPLGGLTYVIGNVFHRAMGDEDTRMILYRQGQGGFNPSKELFVVNNTFVSDKPAIAIDTSLDTAAGDPLPIVRNNIFAIPGAADPVSPKEALEANNFKGDPSFIDQSKFDFHLKEGSMAVDKGAPPEKGAGVDLTPKSEYMHVAGLADRPTDDPIDIGAYEIPGPVMGTGGAGGEGGSSGDGGAGVGGAGQGGAASSSSSSGTGGRDIPGDDEGCGCRVGDAGSSKSAAFVALGLALLYGARRRRGR
jgi:MYXO-CTERM domain-containing protein